MATRGEERDPKAEMLGTHTLGYTDRWGEKPTWLQSGEHSAGHKGWEGPTRVLGNTARDGGQPGVPKPKARGALHQKGEGAVWKHRNMKARGPSG